MLSLAVRLYLLFPKKFLNRERTTNIAKKQFAISVGFLELADTYTTVVFLLLLRPYTKSAIGMGKDANLMEFMAGMKLMQLYWYTFIKFHVALIALKSRFILLLLIN
jgi:hypothetical protein